MSRGAVLEYLDRSIATYAADPPVCDYQRGHLEALKVARAELATIVAQIPPPPSGALRELRQFVDEHVPGTAERDELERIYELLAESLPSPAKLVREMRSSLANYDYLLPGRWTPPDPPLERGWFGRSRSMHVTDAMIVWAGQIARERSLMDLGAAADMIEEASA